MLSQLGIGSSTSSDEDNGFHDYTYEYTDSTIWYDFQEMLRHYRTIAEGHNVVLTTKRSVRPRPNRWGFILLACEQFGQYRLRKRLAADESPDTNTKLRNCPFALVGREFEPGQWFMFVQHGRHNHATPTRDLVGHAYAGRVADAQTGLVSMLSDVGTPPKAVW